MMTDGELLAEYRAGSQAAFSALVERHIDWVYSSALRRVGNAHLAEDVTQAVFMALALNGSTRQGAAMSAWLFTVLRFASSKALRAESRRRRHEAEAARGRPMITHPQDDEIQGLLPMVEDAVDHLGGRDRQAILLRFYQRCSFSEVGEALGTSEDGARKRVARAVEKLRGRFARQGIAVPAGALGDGLFRHAVTTAPLGLASAIVRAPISSPLAKAAIGAMKLRIFLQAACFVAAVLAAALIPLRMRLAAAAGQMQRAAAPANSPPASVPPATEPAMAAEAPTRPVDVTLAQVIAGVKQAEGRIQNLYIKEFETTEELLPAGATEWVGTPERYTGSAWYDGDARGKTRVYFSDEVERASNVKSPWFEAVMDFSWDGKEGRSTQIAGGEMGGAFSPVPHPVVFISDQPRAELGSAFVRWRTGAGFSLNYLVEEADLVSPIQPHVLLSADLERLENIGVKPEIVGQTVNGFDAIRVHYVERINDKISVPVSYWFDGQRGYALVKLERAVYINGIKQIERLEIKELKQIAPGVWFPLRGSWTTYDSPRGGSYRRYNYHAADAVANDPNFDPGIFQVKVPTGYLIADERTNPSKLFIEMPDGTRQFIPLHGAVPRVPVTDATRPDQEEILRK